MRALARLIFPPRCLRCGLSLREDGVICTACFARIEVYDSLHCGQCGGRLPLGKRACHPSFPYVLGAAGSYESEPLRLLIQNLKFQFIRGAALPLASLIATHIARARLDVSSSYVVAMPLGRGRARARGFNQSELIAEQLAQELSLPLIRNALVRNRDTKPQTGLAGRAERRENVRGAFSIPVPAAVRNKRIILVDDVTTSGATFYEAATSLKAAGARNILALAAARA